MSYAERESERIEDERMGNVWALNLSTGKIEKLDHYRLIGVGPPDGYKLVCDLSPVERIAILGNLETTP